MRPSAGVGRIVAGAVGAVHPAPVGGAAFDHVMHFGAEDARLLEAEAELHTLHALNAGDRRGKRRVESAIPMYVRAKPHREPLNHDFEDSADGVSCRACLVDARDHALLCGRVWATERTRLCLFASARAVRSIHGHAANLGGEGPDLNAEGV